MVPVNLNVGVVDNPSEDLTQDRDSWGCKADAELLVGARELLLRHLARHDRNHARLVRTAGGDRSALVGRDALGRGAFIVEDGSRPFVTRGAAQVRRAQRHVEPVVVYGLIGVDDDIITLAHCHEELRLVDGVDGHKVVGDYFERMPDERNRDAVVHACVDEAEEVLLARGQGNPVVFSLATVCRMDILSAEEDVVAVWGSAG